MSIYDQLPVYKAAYDMLLYLFQFTSKLSREYKFTLGEKLKLETTELLINIYRANRIYDKQQPISNARENIEIIRLYIRILHDLKQIGMKKYLYINSMIQNISRQLSGWQTSANKK